MSELIQVAPRQLDFLRRGKELVRRAKTVQEAKGIRDRAEAIRHFAAVSGEAIELQNDAAEIKIRAERRAGELLAKAEKNKGVRLGGSRLEPPGPEPRLSEFGVSKPDSHRWQAMASIPEKEFEAHVEHVRAIGDELTTAGVYRAARKAEIAEVRERDPGPLPQGQYRVVYADPPWSYSNSGFHQSAESVYPTLSTEAICELPVRSLASDDSVLLLWATAPLLREALQVMDAWGFTYKTGAVWLKSRAPGIGWWLQTQHEHLLIGAAPKANPPREKISSILVHDAGAHSEKPPLHSRIESMFFGPYVELFARKEIEGWTSWGNEITEHG